MAHCPTVRHYQFKLVMAHSGTVRHQQFCKKGNKKYNKKTTLVGTFWLVRHYQLQLVMAHCIWMRHQYVWTDALVKIFLILMAHPGPGAPLVVSTLMAYQKVVRHQYILMAHRLSGAPLVSIPSIALFLVVCSHLFLDLFQDFRRCVFNGRRRSRRRRGAYRDFVNLKMMCRLSLSKVLIGVGCACVHSQG